METEEHPANEGESPVLAWHYTTGECALEILADGYLRPATEFIGKGEKPVNWFSLDQNWEATVNKGLINETGERVTASFEEMLELGRGLYRFGIDPGCLVKWPRIAQEAGTPSKIRTALEEVGIRQGANFRLWLGTLETIPIASLRVERMNERTMQWELVTEAEIESDH